jgi:molybdate transport system substrate-binding protein
MRLKLLITAAVCAAALHGQSFQIASAAGYKKPVMEVIKRFEKRNPGIDVEAMFGNMKKTTANAKRGRVSLVVGDKNYLQNRSSLAIREYIRLGSGRVVLAYAKGQKLRGIRDLQNPGIEKIALPQPKKAIYGKGGKEVLQNSNLYAALSDKLYIVATVPQVAMYLITGEVQAGILNLTAALDHEKKLGGYIQMDQSSYSPIAIVAGRLGACEQETCGRFVSFLGSKEAKAVFKQYGL